MVCPPSDADDDIVTWDLDVMDSPLLQTFAYVGPSIFGGVAILVGGLFLWLVILSLLDGDLTRAVGIVVLSILALLSRRYLPALLDTDLYDPLWNRYSRRGLAIASTLGALVLLGSTHLDPMAPFAVFIASWVPVVLTAPFPTSGHADKAAGTLVVDDTEVRLDAVSSFRAISVGSFAVCWLSYTRGVPSAPRVIVIPSRYVEIVSNLIEEEPNTSEKERSPIGRMERFVAGLFGLGMIAIGPVLWVILPPGDGQIVAVYAGAMFGLFGAMLLWYAYTA